MRLSELKNSILSRRVSVGTWISIGHPDVTEMLAHQGFDWLLFDLEHGPLTIESLQRLLQPMNGSPAAALVRTPPEQGSLAGRALDCGADGVVFPLIGDRSQAEAAVDACKYPPLGSRGMGPRRSAGYGRIEAEYLRSANDRTVVGIQIETGDAIERVDQILSVPGVDVALLGLGDLSANLGCHLQFGAPEVIAAVETVLEACRRHDVLPGMAYAHDAATARAWIEQGFRMVGVGSDDVFLLDGSRRALDGLGSLR